MEKESELPEFGIPFGAPVEDDGDTEHPLSPSEEAELREEGVIPKAAEPSPDSSRSNMLSSVHYEQLFNEIFLEVYDIESGFDRAREKFTQVLLSRGVEVNPTQVYDLVELILTRMTKLTVVKRLGMAMGFIGDLDSLMEKEMGLIYSGRKGPPAAAAAYRQSMSQPIADDTDGGQDGSG